MVFLSVPVLVIAVQELVPVPISICSVVMVFVVMVLVVDQIMIAVVKATFLAFPVV